MKDLMDRFTHVSHPDHAFNLPHHVVTTITQNLLHRPIFLGLSMFLQMDDTEAAAAEELNTIPGPVVA